MTDERALISGLRTLKSVLQAFEFEIELERKPLHQLVEYFFPQLEGILASFTSESPNFIQIMILIGKIFFMTNQVSPVALTLCAGRCVLVLPDKA